MKKHKICIIGDGLSGLITAQILGKLDVEIDLISKKSEKKNIDNRLLIHRVLTSTYHTVLLLKKVRTSY